MLAIEIAEKDARGKVVPPALELHYPLEIVLVEHSRWLRTGGFYDDTLPPWEADQRLHADVYCYDAYIKFRRAVLRQRSMRAEKKADGKRPAGKRER